MINVGHNIGLSGEFRVVVRRQDGSVKLDTGMQPNLVLDNGLNFYVGIPLTNNSGKKRERESSDFLAACVVGTGNRAPQVGDVSLQNFVAINKERRDETYWAEEPTTGKHEGFVKLSKRYKYIFDTINNQNITEVGLAPYYGTETIDDKRYEDSYALVTRALIKDSGGTPIAVTVLKGEILEVTYQINMYVDIKRQSGTFTLTTTKDGADTVDTFDYFLQPYGIDSGNYIDRRIIFDNLNISSRAFGVKETDAELTSDYDLNDEWYQSVNHKFNEYGNDAKFKGYRDTSTTIYRTKYSEGYIETTVIERSPAPGKLMYKNVIGVYSHIFTDGIRAFTIPFNLVKGLVVVKNKANGQGIKKTNKQLWEYTQYATISRWEG